MHEQVKIAEAEHFLTKMRAAENDPAAFKFEVSAFLTAGRSVLQYAHKEATGNPRTGTTAAGQTWYNGQVTGRPIVRFLKDERDENIHSKPVVPVKNVHVSVHDVFHVTSTFTASVVDTDGTILSETTVSDTPPPIEPKPSTVSYSHTFSDWSGSEDVPTLCAKYLDELREIVADGVAMGFLTP